MFNEFPSFVAEDSRRFVSQHTGNLYISKVQPSDVGSYICLVKNTVTNARVLSPPTPLTLKTDGEPLTQILGCFHKAWAQTCKNAVAGQIRWILTDKPQRRRFRDLFLFTEKGKNVVVCVYILIYTYTEEKKYSLEVDFNIVLLI